MKTSRLVLAPAVAVALTGLAGAPAFAATESTASVPQQPLCAQGDQQSSSSSESDSSVPDESDPQATLAQAQVTRADIADDKKGIGFSGTGFSPDQKATVTVVGTDGTEYSPDKKLTVDEDGKVSGTYFFTVTDGAQVPVGEYSLYLTDLKSEKKSSKVTFEVVSKASEVEEPGKGDDDKCDSATGPIETPDETPSETKSPEPSETKTEEPTTKAPEPTETKTEEPTTEAPKPSPSETKTEEPTTEAPKPSPSETKTEEPTTEAPKPSPSETDEADDKADEAPADGVKPGPAEGPKDEAPKSDEPTGQPSESEDADNAAEGDKKAEDEAPESTGPASPGTEDKQPAAAAQASMFINPTEVSSENFLGDGIKLGVSGAQPGEKVSITVEHAQGKVDRYTMTKEADSEGKVTFGVQAKVKAVLGTYNVRAQAESFDEPQGGSFTVLTNGTAVDEGGNGTGNGSGSNDSGSDLPRTGAEMTGLALGVGLLAVGAAAVIITRRRMNASDDPAEF
ncbi:LPXTG-motif cell wall anchor domain-containing protein [Brevibacterium iodinum ATCC 49514]|uniref:LPXTG-motif cell wall anchor domain-containing protein n=1 Tax=Brevibacterium iodinum ATCC 49514 TaxID=1255616 RepID=A0A2H1JRK7_9MICO|nr:LPXTG cell wall anchor domain-containing protein [Brevibacterium iodinum]SMX90137.1 LPXTG-motif cell wall anchor domain-containing protein [Brevibacterium iodinum ATCC 49514]